MSVNQRGIRHQIGGKLRELRESRRWSQAHLAELLGTSQPNISQIERGFASLSAEQLIEVLRLFNVPLTAFVGVDEKADLELNALAYHGATHLRLDPRVVPDERADLHETIARVLTGGGARLVTALAPVIVSNIASINFEKLANTLDRSGRRARLYWLLDNVLAACRLALRTARMGSAPRYRRAIRELEFILGFADGSPVEGEDLLEQGIRTPHAVERIKADWSAISQRWQIISSLQIEDFAAALRDSDAG